MNKDRHTCASVAKTTWDLRRSGTYVTEPQEHLVDSFAATMPERYREEFGTATLREHARIVMARGRRPIHADKFTSQVGTGPGLCVVALDEPGLLSLISTALMLEGLEITRADAYTRRTPGGDYEAVDLFWFRHGPDEETSLLRDEVLSNVRLTLRELASGGKVTDRFARMFAGTSPGESETSVRFRNVRGMPWLTLELKSNDRPGLLAVVSSALAAEGVQIVDCRIRTYGLRVHDYFDILEVDGTRLSGVRLNRIQLAVLRAVDGPGSGA